MARPRTDRWQRKARARAPRHAFRPWGLSEILEDRTLLAIFVDGVSGPVENHGGGRGGAEADGGIVMEESAAEVNLSFSASLTVDISPDEGDPDGTEIPVYVRAYMLSTYEHDYNMFPDDFGPLMATGSVSAGGNTSHLRMPDPNDPTQKTFVDYVSMPTADEFHQFISAEGLTTVKVGGTLSLSANIDLSSAFGRAGAGFRLTAVDMRPDWASEPLTLDESNTIHVQFDSLATFNQDGSGATRAGVYWATGPKPEDIIDGAPPLKDYAVQFYGDNGEHNSYQDFITPDLYADPPEGATYLVAVVDRASKDNPHGQVPEFDETDNYQSIRIPRLGIDVSAKYDDDGSPNDNQFGQYLQGIKLDNTFTITTQPSNEADFKLPDLSYLIASVGGDDTYLEHPTDAGNGAKTWKFTYDVGQLSGDTPLKITAYDADGDPVGAPYKGMLHAGAKPDLSLKADYPGGPENPQFLPNFRFIRGVPLDVTYTGDVTGLSKFYIDQNTFPKAKVGLDDTELTWTNTGDRSWTFTTHDDAANLPDNAAASKFTVLTSAGGGSYEKAPGFDQADIRSVALPGWMGSVGQVASFDPAVSDVFAATAGAYVIKPQNISQVLNVGAKLGDVLGIDDKYVKDLLKGLESSFNLNFDLTIYVQPLKAIDPKGKIGTPSLHMRILAGGPGSSSELAFVEDLGALTKQFDVSLGLNPDTLDTTSITIATARPVSLKGYLGDGTLYTLNFGDGKHRLSIPLPAFGIPGVVKGYVEGEVAGTFKAQVDYLDLGASLKLNVGGSGIALDRAGSTVSIYAGASAVATLTASAAVGISFFDVIDLQIAKAVAEGRLVAALAGAWTVSLDGQTRPDETTAALTLAGSVRYDIAAFSDPDPANSGFKEIPLGPVTIPLYHGGQSSGTLKPDIGDPAASEASGAAKTGSKGSPGVKPEDGDTEAEVNTTKLDGSAPQGMYAAGQVRVRSPFASDLGHIKTDVNVVATTGYISPGQHYVQTFVTDDLGNESVVDNTDLAYLAYSGLDPNDNPLGYSSGWKTIEADVPDGLLVPGRLYRVGFRLLTDAGPDGAEQVGVALDGLKLSERPAYMSVFSPDGDISDGTLDFGPDTYGSDTGTIRLSSDGGAPLRVESASIVGSGFVLDDAPVGNFYVPLYSTFDLHVRALNPAAPAAAQLVIRSNAGTRVVTLVSNASVIFVTNTNDSGPGSLRDAIIAANIADRPTHIYFRLDPSDPNFVDVASSLHGGDKDPDVFVITPLSPLPAIGYRNGGITIDGFSQSLLDDSNPFGPEVVLDGSNISYDGLTTGTSNNAILGLNIQGFHRSGISIFGGSGNTIQGNYIGTDPTGTIKKGNVNHGILLAFGASNNQIGGGADGQGNVISGNGGFGVWMVGSDVHANRLLGNVIGLSADGSAALGNGSDGVVVQDSPGNTIGGAAAGEGNVISGNNRFGVWIVSPNAANNLVQGNRIGTNAAGSTAIGNGSDGLIVQDAPRNTIGGTTPGAGNLISGNNRFGVWTIGQNASGTVFQGNRIGTDATGTSSVGNRYEGLFLWDAPGTTVGGSTAGAGNLLSGNGGDGLHIVLSHATGSLVVGNLIGTDATGVQALGNGGAGVSLGSGASSNQIGLPGAGNTIAYNAIPGVLVRDDSVANAIRGNAIYANGGLAIDHWGDGPTANDPGDADTGPNGLQNSPTIASVTSGGATHVVGSFSGKAGADLAIDFYAGGGPDPSGSPRAERWLGSMSITTDPSGFAAFDAMLPGATVAGEWVSATATGTEGTSELSAAVKSVDGGAQATSLTAASGHGTYAGTATFTAMLTYGGSPLEGEDVIFSLIVGGATTDVGTATTDANGAATLTGVGLSGFDAGTFAGAVGVRFAAAPGYAASSATGDLVIDKAVASLVLGGLDADYDGSPHLATVTTTPAGLSGVAITYTQSGLTVDAPTSAGSYAVTATLTNPNYAAPSASGTLVIRRATPVIAWADPADITYGTPLGSGQLDAAASHGGHAVAGTFAYSPASGTVLRAGAGQVLSVTFTPDDTIDYAATTATATINVLRATPTVGAAGGTFTYDGLAHAATGTVLGLGGAALPGVALTFTYNGASAAPIGHGTYAVVASFAGTPDYLPATGSATIEIDPAHLRVAADSLDIAHGDAIPALTATVTGFVHGETAALLSGAPALSTTADPGHAGVYAIAIGAGTLAVAGSNYDFTFMPGALTVHARLAGLDAGAAYRNAPLGSAVVSFTDPIDPNTFTTAALSMTRDGQPVSLAGVTISAVPGQPTQYAIGNLAAPGGIDGAYSLSVDSSAIRDSGGRPLVGPAASATWTLDRLAPTSKVSAFLPQRQASATFSVNLTFSDPAPSAGSAPSGVASYDLYVSTDNGPFVAIPALTGVPLAPGQLAASPSFQGSSNHTYNFRVVVRDRAGNVEQKQGTASDAAAIVPDLDPPVTQVDSVDASNPTFVVAFSGRDVGSATGVKNFDLYVQVDSAPPAKVATLAASPPDSRGVSSGSYFYPSLTDGAEHTYRVFTVGVDFAGNAEAAPSTGDISVTRTFRPPTSLQATGMTVQRGLAGRSFVRFVDVQLNASDTDLIGGSTGALSALKGSGRMTLVKHPLDGSSTVLSSQVLPASSLAVLDHAIEIDFGPKGVGGTSTTATADGYYEIDLDLTPWGGSVQRGYFYRLLGDVDGSGAVDDADVALIAGVIARSVTDPAAGANADADGSGSVTATDKLLATSAKGHKLGQGGVKPPLGLQ